MARKRAPTIRTERTLIALTRDEMELAQQAAQTEQRPLAVFARISLLQRARVVVGADRAHLESRAAIRCRSVPSRAVVV